MSAVRNTADVTIVKGACPHDCPDTCALEIHVRDGVALKVTGSASHEPTAGVLCTKVARYTERTYHPNRLLHPLRRIGRKGEGRFERISLFFYSAAAYKVAIGIEGDRSINVNDLGVPRRCSRPLDIEVRFRKIATDVRCAGIRDARDHHVSQIIRIAAGNDDPARISAT